MAEHPFIFTPSLWLGEGKITLNMLKEELPFSTRWEVAPTDSYGKITSVQNIHISGVSDSMKNEFSVYNFTPDKFAIELENQSLGRIIGKGKISPEVIAWEFRMRDLGFEGFEIYQLVEKDKYMMHAEYATNDDFRSVIHGKIWKEQTTFLCEEEENA